MEVGVETNTKTPTKKHSFSPVTGGGTPVKYFGISNHRKFSVNICKIIVLLITGWITSLHCRIQIQGL